MLITMYNLSYHKSSDIDRQMSQETGFSLIYFFYLC